jgi:hypothetical protein
MTAVIDVKEVREILNTMVNEHYGTPEMLRFFSKRRE